ncbi:unnamed protein product [Phytomonas sp. Hart1]|nr:unnamed protein product [Phytomonas sp. Hart1]|eukprot:CCW70371.1 unnamed protein product [Phytomonas sp. isolate Hart1]
MVDPGGVPPFSTNPREPTPASADRTPCLRTLIDFVDGCIADLTRKYPAQSREAALSRVRRSLAGHLEDGVREMFVQRVNDLRRQWDLQALWSQLNYHVELLLCVLCDSHGPNRGGEAARSSCYRSPNAANPPPRKEAGNSPAEEANLDRLLSTYNASGLLRLTEEVGGISFSLVDAVQRAQAENLQRSKAHLHLSQTLLSEAPNPLALWEGDGGGGRRGP